MDIICIDDKFEPNVLEFYKIHKVSIPVENSFYNIRGTIRHTTGEIGVLLDEIKNPKVPVVHPILGITYMEPSWRSSRFAHLDGSPILEDELKDYLPENLTHIKNYDLVEGDNAIEYGGLN